MRIFKHPNLHNDWKCPLCGTAEDKAVVLIAIAGTEEGHTVQAEQFHADCVMDGLVYYKNKDVIAVKF